MCTVLLPPGVNPMAVKYISYHISYFKSDHGSEMLKLQYSVKPKGDSAQRKVQQHPKHQNQWAAVTFIILNHW
jgi:hypothetical protein